MNETEKKQLVEACVSAFNAVMGDDGWTLDAIIDDQGNPASFVVRNKNELVGDYEIEIADPEAAMLIASAFVDGVQNGYEAGKATDW